MFTVEEIKAAHSRVKSGADFPAYIQAIKKMGVTFYETFVTDGHTCYHGADNYKTASPSKYEALTVAETSIADQFKVELKAHQQGETDYLTFIRSCATLGTEKWEVCMEKMTCSYYDKSGNKILVEQIPE